MAIDWMEEAPKFARLIELRDKLEKACAAVTLARSAAAAANAEIIAAVKVEDEVRTEVETELKRLGFVRDILPFLLEE